ncbi:MAG TPA: hypothetical protein VFC77_05365 [Myxococcota bacterium]|nr:hypothetical protein [Myxococcota bacterium]
MRPPPTLLALAGSALLAAAAARAGDSVVVIRGSSVRVERPPTPERVLDGSAWVEVVRVRTASRGDAGPEPPPPVATAPPPPAVVVVVEPPPVEPAFAFAWGWPWPPALPHHRPPPRRLAPPPFAGAFAPHRGPVRKFVRGPSAHPVCGPRGG